MAAQSILGSVPVDMDWGAGTFHGSAGWTTKVMGSADATRLAAGTDVAQAYVRLLSDVEWKPAFKTDNMPLRYRNERGAVPGCHDISFGGNSNTRLYAAMADGIIRSDDGANSWQDTAVTGLATTTGFGHQRIFSSRAVTHPTDPNIYFASFQHQGVKGTRDGGATQVNMAWLPLPTDPVGTTYDKLGNRFTIIALDDTNPLRIAFCPAGQGVWLSTDGGLTGAKISNGNILSASDMQWRGGELFVAAAVVSANGDQFPNPSDNLWKWSAAGGWVNYPINFGSAGGVQFLVPDTRNVAWWLLLCYTSAYVHTKNVADAATYKKSEGSAESAQYRRAGPFVRCKVRARPLIARKYRNGGGTYACSKPVTIGPWMYWPLGYGPLRTLAADFPTEAGDYNSPTLNWPVMEEDTAGIEEMCGLSALDTGVVSLGLGQDVPVTALPDGSTGHLNTYDAFPSPGTLSNGLCARQSPVVPTFVAFAAYKNGPFCGFSKDQGRTIKPFPVQPANINASIYGPSGGIFAGIADQVVHMPSYGGLPQYTSDCGNSPWSPLRFKLENGTELDLVAKGQYHGFHGAGFFAPHWNCTVDAQGTFWFSNIGAALGATSWETDPAGWGGIYRMRQQDFPIATRVKAGRAINWANFAWLTHRLEMAPDGSELVIFGNSVDGDGNNQNKWVAMDTTTFAYRYVNLPTNIECADFGAPLSPGGPAPLYLTGYVAGVYGLYVSFDICKTAPIGPFNHKIARGGRLVSFSASKVVPGKITAAVDGLGHVIGRLKAA